MHLLLLKTRNNIYASDMSAEVLSQLTSKYLHQKTCKLIPKLARAKRVKMADILSKINIKDTFEILGGSAPNVFENRKTHGIRKRRVQVLKKGSVYIFSTSFLGTSLLICKTFSSILVVLILCASKYRLLLAKGTDEGNLTC
jgi:hypothetical protein